MRGKPGPASTIGGYQKAPGWVWLTCRRLQCGHARAVAIAPYVIRWGPNATSERLRQSAVCEKCGGRGALTYHPSWGGSQIGWVPFPVAPPAE